MSKTILPPLENPPVLDKPPNSPPINIPKKKRRRRKRKTALFFSNESEKVNKFYQSRFEKNKIGINKLRNFKEQLEEIKINLNVFLNLKKGDKLGKYKVSTLQNKENDDSDKEQTKSKNIIIEKKYYKNEGNSYGQWLSRWWWGESREKTIEYLDEDFNDFVKYLDKILSEIECDPLSIFVELVNNIREFISDILTGLYSLKETYPEYIKIVAKVDSIIFTLLDFKEKTDDYLKQKKQNVQLTIKNSGIPIPLEVPETGKPKYSVMPNSL